MRIISIIVLLMFSLQAEVIQYSSNVTTKMLHDFTIEYLKGNEKYSLENYIVFHSEIEATKRQQWSSSGNNYYFDEESLNNYLIRLKNLRSPTIISRGIISEFLKDNKIY